MSKDAARSTSRRSGVRLSMALAFFLLVLAANAWLSRFPGAIFDHHTIFDGANYTDAHITLPGLLFVCAALILGALLAAFNAARNAGGRGLLLSASPAAVTYIIVLVVVAPGSVSSFIVKPNELDRETPFIANNIQLTRSAFGLDRFLQREFPAETTVAATDPANNHATLDNIRLWDWHALRRHAPPGAGNPHLLRLPLHRYRPLQHWWR